MKLKIIFDDLKEAERIISDTSSGGLTFFDACMLTKYYKHQGLGLTKIKKELISFCKIRDENFNVVMNRGFIKGTVDNCKRFKLRNNVDKVIVTKDELDILTNTDLDHRYAKVLFVMLVVAKREKFMTTRVDGSKKPPEKIGYFFNYPISSALSLAKVRLSKDEREKMLYYLDGQNKFIEATARSSKSWRVCFASDSSKPEIIVDDFDNLIDFLPFYCIKCGKVVEIKARHKMCQSCYKEWRNRGRNY